jgi:hypothetical protein
MLCTPEARTGIRSSHSHAGLETVAAQTPRAQKNLETSSDILDALACLDALAGLAAAMGQPSPVPLSFPSHAFPSLARTWHMLCCPDSDV